MHDNNLDLDNLINRLLEARKRRLSLLDGIQNVQMSENEIRQLCRKAINIFMSQPYKGCKSRFSIRLWKAFTDSFNCLPIAAVVDEKIFCCHGGLSPHLQSMEQIRRIMRPTDVPDSGLLCDLLWSDPSNEVLGWGENDRGVSFTFGRDIAGKFLSYHKFDLICRAHQVVEDGYEFFSKRRLVTIFSAPNYCGEFDNAGAFMSVDETLMRSFQILEPSLISHRRKSTNINKGRIIQTPPPKNRQPKIEEMKIEEAKNIAEE